MELEGLRDKINSYLWFLVYKYFIKQVYIKYISYLTNELNGFETASYIIYYV